MLNVVRLQELWRGIDIATNQYRRVKIPNNILIARRYLVVRTSWLRKRSPRKCEDPYSEQPPTIPIDIRTSGPSSLFLTA